MADVQLMVNEQEEFLSLLQIGPKYGNIIKYNMSDGKLLKARSSKNISALVSADNTGNTYVTVNSFSGKKRRNKNLFAINGIYIDIDGHSLSEIECKIAKINTIKCIDNAIRNGKLCNYTAAIDSGRGIGLLFLYDRSISAHGNTEKQIKFHKSLYRKMIRLIDQLLTNDPGLTLSVDKTVSDTARLCGLPGTYNYSAHAYRKIIRINHDARYSLSEIAEICNFTYNKKEQKETKKNTKSIVELGISRTNKLKKLQASRQDWCGMHHQLCFVYYNTVKLYMNMEDAEKALREFNDNFADYGISENEIKGIVASSHGSVSIYAFSNAYIANTFNLSESEALDFMFETKESRAEKKRQTLIKRLERDKRVVEAILNCDTYEEVSYFTGVSVRTIKRIAKKYDCGHTNGSIKKPEDVDWNMFDADQFISNEKSAKKCYMDVKTNHPCLPSEKMTQFESDAVEEDSTKTYTVKEVSSRRNTVKEEPVICFNGVDDDLSDLDAIFDRKKDLPEDPFHIDGINFDITDEDEDNCKNTYSPLTEKELQIKGAHPYAVSFLTYLCDNLIGEYKDIAERMKNGLCHIPDKDVLEKVLSAIDFMASQYSYDPELKAAAFDIDHLYKALCNGHISITIHGSKRAVPEKHDKYPDEYEPIDNIDTVFEKLKPDFAICNVQSILDNAENVRKWLKAVLVNKGWNQCEIDGITVFREDLVKAMKKLTIYDITSIINAAGRPVRRWGKKMYIPDNFIEYRTLFFRQCALKGYI